MTNGASLLHLRSCLSRHVRQRRSGLFIFGRTAGIGRPLLRTGGGGLAKLRCIFSETKSALTALLIVAAMIAPASLAQMPSGGGAQGMGAEHPARGNKTTDQAGADALRGSGAPVMVQLDQLESDLKLTAEQRPAWNAYADKILHLADYMTRSRFAARASAQPTQGTAAQQLDQLADSERNRLSAVEDIAETGKALYAKLTSEQKAIADRGLVLPIRPLATGVAVPGIGDAANRGRGATTP